MEEPIVVTSKNAIKETARLENKSTGSSTVNGGSQPIPKPIQEKDKNATLTDGTKKLSGAELKKQKQLEKQAKRAASRTPIQPTPISDPKTLMKGQPPDAKKRAAAAGSASVSGSKQSQKPVLGKTLPLRPAHLSTEKPSTVPAKESKRVALFGHLYHQQRRETIAGANKDVHSAVLALGLQISSYVICGSSARCVAMLLAFKRVIESYVTPPGNSLTRHLAVHLSPQIEYLVSCRPLSTSMGNAIRWLKQEINAVDVETSESEAKSELCEAIDCFIRDRITLADEAISKTAAKKIQDGDVIVTFAKSSIVQQTLLRAHREGTRFRVIVIDSRPLFEGKNLTKALVNGGIEVQYALTHSISHVMKTATKVFLGAHSLMSNGRLYSRIGSAMVAMTARGADVPVIVCCQSVKFTDKIALDSIVVNEMAPPDELTIQGKESTPLKHWRDSPNIQLLNLLFDATPAECISMIITEFGPLPPTSVPVVHRLSTNT